MINRLPGLALTARRAEFLRYRQRYLSSVEKFEAKRCERGTEIIALKANHLVISDQLRHHPNTDLGAWAGQATVV